jgi:integrase
MSSILKIKNQKGLSYRVHIRRKGMKAITKTFPSKKLANEFALRVESDRRLQLAYGAQSAKIVFTELAEDYLENSYKGKQPKKQRSRLNYWTDLLSDRKVGDITKRDIAQGMKDLPIHLSNATRNRYKAVISVVFSYACSEFDLPENPVRYIRSLPENNARTRFLSDNERSRLFEAARQSDWDKLYLLVLLAITTGARKGELLSLKWCDVDFDRQTAFISTTKNGQPKVLPLTNSVVVELSKFVQSGNSLIFNSEITMDSPFCFYKQWKKALLSADIENFRFHDLRHTTASYLAQNGASLLEIADVLGHKQIQMTKRYAHLCIDHKQRLINKVLGGITEG